MEADLRGYRFYHRLIRLPCQQSPFFQSLAKAVCYTGILVSCLVPALADPLDHWTFRFRNNPTNPSIHYDVVFGNGLFVAVGQLGGDQGSIYTSPDGVTWTPRHQVAHPTNNYTFTLGELRRILWVNGRFVTVGWNYAAYASDNGIDWVGGVSPGLGTSLEAGFFDMCYGQGKFVAIDGSSGRSNILTSANGYFFTRQRVSLSHYNLLRVGYGNGTFVALGAPDPFRGFTPYFTSTNATSWTYHQIDALISLTGLTWAKQLFVAVGGSYYSPYSGVILTSPDGISWTPRDSGLTNPLSRVEYINGLFLATGDSVLLTSTNGINWDARPSTNNISRFTLGNGALVGISGGPDIYQTDPLLSLSLDRATPPELSITGIAGQNLRVEYAEDSPAGWQSLATFSIPSSPYSWTDTNAGVSSRRFYRGIWLP